MTGLTITEMMEILKLEYKTVEGRLQRAKIKPMTKDALYSTDTLELIRNVPGKGRPKNPNPPEPKPKKPIGRPRKTKKAKK